MDLGLRGRTVLITGGSKGIGAGTAKVMAAEGASLILVARNRVDLEQTRKGILTVSGVKIEIAPCDLSDASQITALARQFRSVDILVNNAGSVPSGTLFELSEQRWRDGWDSKVLAYTNMCRAFYPVMKARGRGVIVNVIGAASQLKRPDRICISMGNAALDVLTQTLGATSHTDNIRVVGVSPGPVDTERYRHSVGMSKAGAESGSVKVPGLPFNRMATPEELGAAIAFVASERCAYMSGAIVIVDGGISASKAAV